MLNNVDNSATKMITMLRFFIAFRKVFQGSENSTDCSKITYPRLVPFGTKMGNTHPTIAQTTVKKNSGKNAAPIFVLFQQFPRNSYK